MKKYKKVDTLSLSLEECELKQYFRAMSLDSSRLFFRQRALTVTSCRMHYRSDKTNISEAFQCISCKSEGKKFIVDQISHWAVCSSYSHLKSIDNVYESDEALCDFYKKVIHFRRGNEQNFQN